MAEANEKENNSIPEKEPERPLECTECKKPIAVYYTLIVGETMTRTCMCADCPVLRHRLQGSPHFEVEGKSVSEAGLVCGNCGTSLEAIRLGTPLGCNACYEVFDDMLIPEMLAANKIPQRVSSAKKFAPIHIGRAPGELQEVSPSLRLLALNEALNEMLKSEQYEQAAWLRDQIKALTEQKGDKSEKTEKENEKK